MIITQVGPRIRVDFEIQKQSFINPQHSCEYGCVHIDRCGTVHVETPVEFKGYAPCSGEEQYVEDAVGEMIANVIGMSGMGRFQVTAMYMHHEVMGLYHRLLKDKVLRKIKKDSKME